MVGPGQRERYMEEMKSQLISCVSAIVAWRSDLIEREKRNQEKTQDFLRSDFFLRVNSKGLFPISTFQLKSLEEQTGNSPRSLPTLPKLFTNISETREREEGNKVFKRIFPVSVKFQFKFNFKNLNLFEIALRASQVLFAYTL